MKSTLSRYSTQMEGNSAQKTKLRKILKSRDNHKELVEMTSQSPRNKNTTSIQQIQFEQRLQSSKSLKFEKVVVALPNHSTEIKMQKSRTHQKLEPIQPEEQQPRLFDDIITKLNEMDQQADDLIRKKIAKMTKKEHLITLKYQGKDQLSEQIEALASRIKRLSASQLAKVHAGQAQLKYFTDKKIQILQKLLAETSTQSEVLKKYFFAISAKNQKQPQKILHRSLQTNNSNPNPKKTICRLSGLPGLLAQSPKTHQITTKTLSQSNYNKPNPNQYQTYRHKHQQYIANNQPLPRSSYNRDFLIPPNIDNFHCKNLDHLALFGNSRLNLSNYARDYQTLKTDLLDFRILDSYRNKISNVDVSYNFRNRKQEADNYLVKSRKYLQEQMKMRYNNRMSATPSASIQQEVLSTNSGLELRTQSQTKYAGSIPIQSSTIRNKQLETLKYNYKSLINN